MKKVVLLLMLVLTFVSCSLEDDGSNVAFETLPIKEAIVPDSFQLNSRPTIMVKYDLPSGCYSYFNMLLQEDGNATIVAVNASVTNGSCTQALIEEEGTFEIIVNRSEDYIFRFWKGQDESGENIFEEIVVPVVVNK